MTTLPMTIGRGAPVPARAHAHDAGIDLYAAKRVHVEPGEVTVVPTGVRVAIPAGHVGLVMLRSSLAAVRELALANGVGVIDAGYRGEIGVSLTSWSPTPDLIDAGERIAQLLVVPIVTPAVEVVDELPPSGDGRGSGGFGSSGRGSYLHPRRGEYVDEQRAADIAQEARLDALAVAEDEREGVQ